MRVRDLALARALAQQIVRPVPAGQRDGPAAHQRAVAGGVRMAALLLGDDGFPRLAARHPPEHAARLNPDVGRVRHRPGGKPPGQIVQVQRALVEQALRQRKRHLGVVGEGAGGQAPRDHLANQIIERARRSEFQRHAQRVANRRAHRAAARAVQQGRIQRGRHPVSVPFVLGTPPRRGSSATATARARPSALNSASALW